MGSFQRKADATTNQNCWIRKIKIECWSNSRKMQALVKSKYLKIYTVTQVWTVPKMKKNTWSTVKQVPYVDILPH